VKTMNEINFSKRLSGITATIIYAALLIGFAPSILINHYLNGTPAGFALMALGVFVYGLAVTVGWRWVVQQRSALVVRGYFTALSLLILMMFVLENLNTDGGAVLNLTVILLLQSGVLPVLWQLGLHLAMIAAVMMIAAVFMPLEQFILPTSVLLLTNGAVVLMGYLIVRDEQTQLALETANRKLTEYATQAEELATMRERNRLAREIHDNLGHYLTVVNTQIEAARTVLDTDRERSIYLLERAQALTKDGLTEIRRSVAALRSAPVEQRPLSDAIRALLSEYGASGLKLEYQVEGEQLPISETVEQVLYRAAQEGLTNLHRHARATAAELRLIFRKDQVSLFLHDNGIGSANPTTGFGLLGVQERVKLIGGRVTIETAPGAGFLLHVEVPM